jgi:hypothetical protein
MTAAGTEAVEFQTVGLDDEAVAGGHLFLQTLDLAVFELHDLSAVGANEVVVVAFVGDVVVLRLSAEVSRLRQAGFAKEIECPVDRRQPQVRILFRQLVIHRFRGDMFLFEKGIKNQLPLPGVFQLMFPEMLFQNRDFFLMLRHGGRPNSCWEEPLKTKQAIRVKRIGREKQV